jgi:hypothetical protein
MNWFMTWRKIHVYSLLQNTRREVVYTLRDQRKRPDVCEAIQRHNRKERNLMIHALVIFSILFILIALFDL